MALYRVAILGDKDGSYRTKPTSDMSRDRLEAFLSERTSAAKVNAILKKLETKASVTATMEKGDKSRVRITVPKSGGTRRTKSTFRGTRRQTRRLRV
jgi:hypothetical protein